MEKICECIYIDNSKGIIIKLDENGENYFSNGNIDIINEINMIIATYPDCDHKKRVFSIIPNIATKAEFILTNKCNMGCIYCYSSTRRNTNTIDFKQAAAVVDRLIINSQVKYLKTGRVKKIYISFHGGGEPSCEFGLLKAIVEYAKTRANKSKTEINFEITTNLSQNNDHILDYYIQNGFFIHISMDGIKRVQDYQRPYANGSTSFATVDRNIRYLSKRNALFSVRLTITDKSLSYAFESVKYLREMFPNIRFIKLAPLETSDISLQNDLVSPDLSNYLKVMEEIDFLPWDEDSHYLSVFGETDMIVNSGMCAPVRFEQLIISPEGVVTACHEDPLSEHFRYGEVTKCGEIIIDNKKVDILKKERFDNIISGSCSDCAFRLLCMGGCKHRMMTTDRNMFCAIEKYTLIKHIKRIFSETNTLLNKMNQEYKRLEYCVNDKTGYIEIFSFLEVQ